MQKLQKEIGFFYSDYSIQGPKQLREYSIRYSKLLTFGHPYCTCKPRFLELDCLQFIKIAFAFCFLTRAYLDFLHIITEENVRLLEKFMWFFFLEPRRPLSRPPMLVDQKEGRPCAIRFAVKSLAKHSREERVRKGGGQSLSRVIE